MANSDHVLHALVTVVSSIGGCGDMGVREPHVAADIIRQALEDHFNEGD